MKIIAGLGNPGSQYQGTRHNAGFMVVDALAKRHGIDGVKRRFQSQVAETRIGAHRCLLIEPETYMNRSGAAISAAMRYFDLDVDQLLVVVDDVALPVGTLRLRPSGSPGGHNGLKDIEAALDTRDYARLRIGIDPPPGQMRQVDYVLGRFTKSQLAELEPAIDRACDAIEAWLNMPIDQAMSRFNG